MQKQILYDCYKRIFQKRTILDRDTHGFPQARFVNPEFQPIQEKFTQKGILHNFLFTATKLLPTMTLLPVHKTDTNCE